MRSHHEYQGDVLKLLGFDLTKEHLRSATIRLGWNTLIRIDVEQYPNKSDETVPRSYILRLEGDSSEDGRVTPGYRAKVGLVVQGLGGPERGVREMTFTMQHDRLNTMTLVMEQSLDHRISMGMDSGMDDAISALSIAVRGLVREEVTNDNKQAQLL